MLRILFEGRSPKNILCLGAHCDDLEIGCGGTILRYVKEMKGTNFHWVVFSSDDHREKEALGSAKDFLKGASRRKIAVNRFRNSFFPYQGAEIKEYFEDLKREFHPDLIFTHYREDLHQDHRIINELTWNTFRNHLILEYEIPKFDGDLGSPNFFVHLDAGLCRSKSRKIFKHFKSQRDKQWFTEDTFLALSRLRGVESNAPGRHAEGYYCRKIVS